MSGPKISKADVDRLLAVLDEPLPPAAKRVRERCLWVAAGCGAVALASAGLDTSTPLAIGPRWYALCCMCLAGTCLISALTEIRHGRISILVRTGTVHRKTRPLAFAFCALAAIALLGGLTLVAGRVLLFGATGLPIN